VESVPTSPPKRGSIGYCSFAYSALASFRIGMSGVVALPEGHGVFVGGEGGPDAGGIGTLRGSRL
jgi:hypothetical protein